MTLNHRVQGSSPCGRTSLKQRFVLIYEQNSYRRTVLKDCAAVFFYAIAKITLDLPNLSTFVIPIPAFFSFKSNSDTRVSLQLCIRTYLCIAFLQTLRLVSDETYSFVPNFFLAAVR